MPNLEQYVKGVMEEGLAAKSPNEAAIMKQTQIISAEEKKIGGLYTKIGECYYKLKDDDKEGSEKLAALCEEVKTSEKAIHKSKMKIGELLGYTFCETCGEQVDEEALFCNNCGSKMPVKLMPGMVLCPHCSKPVKESFRFCTYCGMSMSVEEEEEKDANVKTCPHCGFERHRAQGGQKEEGEETLSQGMSQLRLQGI